MTLRKVTTLQNIRGKPECNGCGANIRQLFQKGRAVYKKRKGSRKGRYYCAKCKADLFGGVKLREDEE